MLKRKKSTNSPISFPSWDGTVVKGLMDPHRCGVISSMSSFVGEAAPQTKSYVSFLDLGVEVRVKV